MKTKLKFTIRNALGAGDLTRFPVPIEQCVEEARRMTAGREIVTVSFETASGTVIAFEAVPEG